MSIILKYNTQAGEDPLTIKLDQYSGQQIFQPQIELGEAGSVQYLKFEFSADGIPEVTETEDGEDYSSGKAVDHQVSFQDAYLSIDKYTGVIRQLDFTLEKFEPTTFDVTVTCTNDPGIAPQTFTVQTQLGLHYPNDNIFLINTHSSRNYIKPLLEEDVRHAYAWSFAHLPANTPLKIDPENGMVYLHTHHFNDLPSVVDIIAQSQDPQFPDLHQRLHIQSRAQVEELEKEFPKLYYFNRESSSNILNELSPIGEKDGIPTISLANIHEVIGMPKLYEITFLPNTKQVFKLVATKGLPAFLQAQITSNSTFILIGPANAAKNVLVQPDGFQTCTFTAFFAHPKGMILRETIKLVP